MKQLILSICVCLILIVLPYEPTHAVSKKNARHFCGRDLSEMLFIVCGGQYASKTKKSYYGQFPGQNSNIFGGQNGFLDYSSEVNEPSYPMFPFKSRENANLMLPNGLRKRTSGIVNECCENACTLKELEGYCAK